MNEGSGEIPANVESAEATDLQLEMWRNLGVLDPEDFRLTINSAIQYALRHNLNLAHKVLSNVKIEIGDHESTHASQSGNQHDLVINYDDADGYIGLFDSLEAVVLDEDGRLVEIKADGAEASNLTTDHDLSSGEFEESEDNTEENLSLRYFMAVNTVMHVCLPILEDLHRIRAAKVRKSTTIQQLHDEESDALPIGVAPSADPDESSVPSIWELVLMDKASFDSSMFSDLKWLDDEDYHLTKNNIIEIIKYRVASAIALEILFPDKDQRRQAALHLKDKFEEDKAFNERSGSDMMERVYSIREGSGKIPKFAVPEDYDDLKWFALGDPAGYTLLSRVLGDDPERAGKFTSSGFYLVD